MDYLFTRKPHTKLVKTKQKRLLYKWKFEIVLEFRKLLKHSWIFYGEGILRILVFFLVKLINYVIFKRIKKKSWRGVNCEGILISSMLYRGFPGGTMVKNPPANVGHMGSILGSWISPGGGNDNLHQYSCLGNPMDRGTWWPRVHGVAKSRK